MDAAISSSNSNEPSRDEKLEMAQKVMSRFKKKRKNSGGKSLTDLSVSDPDLVSSGVGSGSSAGGSLADLGSLPSVAISSAVPAAVDADPFYTPEKSGRPVAGVSATPGLLNTVTVLNDTARMVRKSDPGSPSPAVNDNRKSTLDHVEYVERMNGVLSKENKNLAASLKQLREELAMVQNERDASSRHQAAVDAMIAKLNARIEELEALLADAMRRSADLDAARQENDHLGQKNVELISAQTAMADRLRELEAAVRELDAMRKSNAELQQALVDAKKDTSLQQQLKESESKIESLRALNKDLMAQVKKSSAVASREPALQQEVDRLKKALDAAEASRVQEQNISQSKIADLTKQLGPLKDALQKEKSSTESDAQKQDRLVSENVRLKSHIDSLLATVKELEWKNGSLSANSAQSQISDLAGKLEQSQIDIQKLKDALQSSADKSKADLARLQQQLLEKDNAYAEALGRLKDLKQAKDDLNLALNESQRDLADSGRKSNEEIARIMEKLRELEAANDQLSSDIQLHIKANAELEVAVDDRNAANAALKSEAENLNVKLVEMQNSVGKMQKDNAFLQSENDSLRDAFEENSKDAQEKLAANESDIAKFRIDADALKSENTALREAFEENVHKAAKDSAEMQAEHQALVDQLRSELDRLKAEYDSLSSQVGKQAADSQIAIAALEAELAEKDEQLRELLRHAEDTSALQELQNALDAVKTKLATTLEQSNLLRDDNSNKAARINELSAKSDDLASQLQQSLADAARARSSDAEIAQLRQDLQNSQANESYRTYYEQIGLFLKQYFSEDAAKSLLSQYASQNPLLADLANILSTIRAQSDSKADSSELEELKRLLLLSQENEAQSAAHHSELEEMVQQLTTQRVALESQLKSLTKSLENEKQSSASFESVSAELAFMKSNVKKQQEERDSFISKIGILEAGIAQKSRQVQQLEQKQIQANAQYQVSIENVQREKESAAASIDMLENLLADEKERCHRLQEQVEHWEQSANHQQTAESPDWQIEKEELKSLLHSATDDLESTLHSLATAQDAKAEAERELEILRTERIDAESKLKSLAFELGLSQFADNFLGLITAIGDGMKLQKSSTDEPFSPTNELMKDMNSLRQSFSDEADSKAVVINADLQQRLAEANSQISSLSTRLHELNEVYESQITSKTNAIISMTETIDALRLELDQKRVLAAEEVIHTHHHDSSQMIADMENTVKIKTEEIRSLRSRLQEFEESLNHAERTISTLTQELDKRQSHIDVLRTELEARVEVRKSNDISGQQSPTLENQVEDAILRAGETVNVIDELVMMANRKRGLSTSSRDTRGVSPEPAALKFESLLRSLAQELQDIKTSMGRNSVGKLEHLLSDLISSIKTTESIKHHSKLTTTAEQEYLMAMRVEDEKEINRLRQALSAITSNPLSGHDNSNDVTVGLFQAHVRQLRSVWEHETQANQVLRKLLEELRERYMVTDQEYSDELNNLRGEVSRLSVSKSRSGSQVHLATINAEQTILQQEIAALKQSIDLLEKENSRLRVEYRANEFAWRTEKNGLLDELHAANMKSSPRLIDRTEPSVQEIRQMFAMEITTLKKTFREEKQTLLIRFREKIQEFETANKSQHEALSKLREERRRFAAKSGAAVSDQQSSDDNFKLRQEIAALRKEQELLNANLKRERTKFEAQMDFQKQILEKEQVLTESITSIERSFSQSLGNQPIDLESLRREKQRHQAHCRKLIEEIILLRARCKREAGYRADLIYQKHYLLLLMGGYEGCDRFTQSLIGKGRKRTLALFRKAATAVLFVVRVRLVGKHANDELLHR